MRASELGSAVCISNREGDSITAVTSSRFFVCADTQSRIGQACQNQGRESVCGGRHAGSTSPDGHRSLPLSLSCSPSSLSSLQRGSSRVFLIVVRDRERTHRASSRCDFGTQSDRAHRTDEDWKLRRVELPVSSEGGDIGRELLQTRTLPRW